VRPGTFVFVKYPLKLTEAAARAARTGWSAALGCLAASGAFTPGLHGADASLPTLTNFQQVIALNRAEATDNPHPVRVRGVVAFPAHGPRDMFHLHDGTNGVAVTLLSVPGLRTALAAPFQVGQYIEVEGETAFGSSHPFVARATARVLGPGRFSPPRPARGSELAAGRHHGNIVKLRATVLDVSRGRGHVTLMLAADGYGFMAELSAPPEHLPVEWLGASLELQGMPWLQFDGAGKVTSFQLLIGSNAWVRVVKPGSSNLYAGPRRTLREVADAPLADDRVVVSGTVTHASALNFFALQDATGVAFAYAMTPISKASRDGNHVERPPRPALRPGDRVEVVASKNARRAHSPQLNSAEYRVIGREELPEPPLITEAMAMSGQHDGRRVRIRGRVVDRDAYSQGEAMVSRLWLKFGDLTSYVIHAGSNHVKFPVPTGGLVDLTGLCVVSSGAERPVRHFSIYVDSPSDVRPLPEPPAWLSATVLRIGGAAGGVLGLAFGWVWLLRRQVARQTQQLRASEERFHKAFQSSPGSLAILSYPDARYVDVNDGFTEIFGWPREEVLGRTSLELGLWPEPAARERLYQQFRAHGAYHHEETPVRKRSGEIITVVQSGELIDIGGRACILVSALDITARKQVEAELMKTVERERELGELKTNFVSMVSHEFRTPLEVIVSSTDILDRYLDRLPAPERAEHLRAIQDSVKRMSGMMEDVLLLGRFESDRQQFRPDDLHLTACCRRLADEMRSATGGRCPIQLSLADDLPLARADESLLRHILTNLLSNAVKYSSAGSPVRLSLGRDGPDAVFRIEDTGLGIPAADQAHLFEAFHRGRNARQISGTGLGLVIVKRSVELHGGRIEFTSEEGKGTKFTVRLPVFSASEP
jgi:PAS domain S-box-containing protein